MKKFRCCFPDCKFKHETLLAVVNHLSKEHNLKINGRDICVHRSYGNLITFKEEEKEMTEEEINKAAEEEGIVHRAGFGMIA